jgi:transcriptional/translational regulatory protein YebC/TACO1
VLRVLTAPADLADVRAALEAGEIEIESADVVMDPKTTVEFEESDAKTLLKLMDALEDHDDVEAVHANFDISEEVLEALA